MSNEFLEKLQVKFQNVSRSKDSIQGLSLWIMHHKDNYKEIVDHWLRGISNDCNTLSMFYVANEVIQGCGKKKCTEFREAFSQAIEEAASFEHVKELKDRIIRLIALWKERSIYDVEYFQRIKNILNSIVEESSEEESSAEELSEQEVIAQFNKQILIDELRKLKSLELKTKEKEEIAMYADVPQLPDLEKILLREECLNALKKCDAYTKEITECINLSNKKSSLQRRLLKELNKNCIFYAAQQKDVKGVANAFGVYGKRVKKMKTAIEEKVETFSMPSNSPCFSEDTTASSNFGPYNDTDDSSLNTSISPNASNEKFHNSATTSKETESFSGQILSEAKDEPVINLQQDKRAGPNFLNLVFNNTVEPIKKGNIMSPNPSDEKKMCLSPRDKSKDLKIYSTNITSDQTGISDKITNDSLQQKYKSPEIFPVKEIKKDLDDNDTFSENMSLKLLEYEVLENSNENNVIGSNSAMEVDESSLEQKHQCSTEQDKSISQSLDEVDNLLEESYDKKSLAKPNYKRKIDPLLILRTKKQCNEQKLPVSEQASTEKVLVFNLNQTRETQPENKSEDYNDSIQAEKSKKECKISPPIEVIGILNESEPSEKVEEITELKALEKNLELMSPLNESDIYNVSPYSSDESPNKSNSVVSMSNMDSNEQSLSFDRSATFTGNSMLSFFSSNIRPKDASQSEKEKKPFDHSDFFTSKNLASPSVSDDSSHTATENPPKAEKSIFSAKSSFMFNVSTDFLKNILQNNNQNVLKSTNNEAEDKSPEIPPVSNFIASVENEMPSITLNRKLLDMDTSQDCEKSSNSLEVDTRPIEKASDTLEIDTRPIEQASDNLEVDAGPIEQASIIPSTVENAKSICDDSLCSINMKLNKFPSDIVSSSDNHSLNLNKSKILDEKPSLNETLQNVLTCLSENMQPKCDMSISAVQKPICLEPPLSITNMLKLYNFLHEDCLNLSSTTCNSQSTVTADNTGGNYEVMDMECDSDENDS